MARYGRPYDAGEPYHREPFAVDVSEGKTDPLHRAHGYLTDRAVDSRSSLIGDE